MGLEKEKFNIIKTLEDWRWKQDIKEYFFEVSFYNFHNDIKNCFNKNKFEINDPNLAEKILLTHYLVYICDRQMDYRHVFKAGGYVVSHLVEEYLRQKKDNKSYDEYDWSKIFKICRMYKERKNGKNQYSYFLCAPINSSEQEEERKVYNYFKKRGRIIDSESLNEEKDNEKIYHLYFDFDMEGSKEYALFSSRNMLQDIGCMYKTLSYLNKNAHENEKFKNSKQKQIEKSKRIIKNDGYNGSFTEFLRERSNDICEYDDKSKKINKETTGLARALFELTYQRIPQISAPNKKVDDFKNFFNYITNQISGAFKKEKIENDYPLQHNRHSLKRMWCIIRDLLVNPVFSACFKCIIGNDRFTNLKKEYDRVELPGDVWNNNSKFGYCFWGESDNYKSSGYVRDRYNKRKENKEKWGRCLPIHFDVTFNFVPRMCEEDKCDICPLAKHSCDENIENIGKSSNWEKLICPFEKEYKPEEKNKEKHEDKNVIKLCPVVLYSCGIKHKCKGDKCPFK